MMLASCKEGFALVIRGGFVRLLSFEYIFGDNGRYAD